MAPTHYIVTDIMQVFAKEVETKSNGRIKITFFYSESLGKAKDEYDMATKGITDFTWFVTQYAPGRFPLTDLLSLPFAFATGAEGTLIAAQLRPHLEREYSDVKWLALVQSIPYPIGFRNKRVAKLEDLKGIKLRTTGGMISDTVSLLGAVPVELPGGEMYTGLERGTVDGILLSFASWSGYKIEEVTKYAVDCGGLGAGSNFIGINKGTFAKLSPDLQQIIEEAAANLQKMAGGVYDTQDVKARKQIEARGTEIVYLPPDEIKRWRALAQPTYDKWVQNTKKLGLPADEVMNAFKKAQDEVRKK